MRYLILVLSVLVMGCGGEQEIASSHQSALTDDSITNCYGLNCTVPGRPDEFFRKWSAVDGSFSLDLAGINPLRRDDGWFFESEWIGWYYKSSDSICSAFMAFEGTNDQGTVTISQSYLYYVPRWVSNPPDCQTLDNTYSYQRMNQSPTILKLCSTVDGHCLYVK